MKKILYITYYWPPSGGAGVQRSLKFVKYLPEFGIEPVVLTVDPGRATYPVLDETLLHEIPSSQQVVRTDSFEPLQILSRFSKKENIPYGGFANPGKEKFSQKILRFIRGNFFIPDARKGWVKYAVRAASQILNEQQINTVVISSPPHSSQLIGLELRKKFPTLYWVADLRDPWTDIYYYKEMFHTGWAKNKDLRYERQVLESCNAALVVSQDIKRLFLKKSTNINEKKIHVIPNGYDETDFKWTPEVPFHYFLVTYVGTIADSYDPEIFFSSLRKVANRFSTVPVRLRFVGSVSSQVSELIRRYNFTDQTEFISHVSHDEAIRYMQVSSLLILVIPHIKNDKGILTGKLFEYMGSKRPIVGIGPPDGDAASILNECESGKMFDRSESAQLEQWLTEQVLQWQKNPVLNAGNDHVKNYSRKELTNKLSGIIG